MAVPGRRLARLTVFSLELLEGWRWKLPAALLLGVADLGGLILLPLTGAGIIDALRAGSWLRFRRLVVILGAITGAQIGVAYLQGRLALCIEEQVGNRLRRRVVDAVLGRPLGFFRRHWLGDIVSRTLNDSAGLKGFLTGVLLQLVIDILTLAVVVVLLLRLHALLAVMTIVTSPITLAYLRSVSGRLEAGSLSIREKVAALSGNLHVWLSRPLTLKADGLEPVASRRIAACNDGLTARTVRFGLLNARVAAVNGALLQLPSLLIFGYGGHAVLQGALSIGDLFAFMTFSSYFSAPIQRLIGLQATIPALHPLYRRIAAFLDEGDPKGTAAPAGPSEEAGAASTTRPGKAAEPVTPVRIAATDLELTADGFHLAIPALEARAGEILGITGPNGAGKSTLLRLLAGIERPSRGEVRIDAAGGGSLAPATVRAAFGILLQQPAPLDGTLLENVTLFDPDPDGDRLEQAAAEAGLSTWIDELPGGWQTLLSAGTAEGISGGQLQRLALARLLYRRPAILMLDEPEARLDRSARAALAGTLRRLAAGRIVILVTHAPELLAACRRVYRIRPPHGSVAHHECAELPASLPVSCPGSEESL
jgi:ABC-type bacteriocin/lantibiotic exporter with double-glycine peptidase domain